MIQLTSPEDIRKILLEKVKPSELGIKPDQLIRSDKASVRIEAKIIENEKINNEALSRVGLKAEYKVV